VVNLHRRRISIATTVTSKELSFNPLLKQSANHHRPHPLLQVKSLGGIIGNEHADALAKKSATTYSDIADASIRIAGPDEGNFFYNIHWLTKEDTENQTQTHT
jgi:hypothetical protein